VGFVIILLGWRSGPLPHLEGIWPATQDGALPPTGGAKKLIAIRYKLLPDMEAGERWADTWAPLESRYPEGHSLQGAPGRAGGFPAAQVGEGRQKAGDRGRHPAIYQQGELLQENKANPRAAAQENMDRIA